MTTATAPRRSYEKGLRRREHIIDTAVTVFAERGYTSGSMREIATRAGIAQGSLLHYFANKSDLLTEVLRRRDRSVEEAMSKVESHDLLGQLLALVEHSAANRNLTALFTLLSAEATNEDHDAHRYFTERYEQQHASSGELIEAGQKAGLIRKNLEPDIAAASLIALIDGLQLQMGLRPNIDAIAIVRDYWAEYVAA